MRLETIFGRGDFFSMPCLGASVAAGDWFSLDVEENEVLCGCS